MARNRKHLSIEEVIAQLDDNLSDCDEQGDVMMMSGSDDDFSACESEDDIDGKQFTWLRTKATIQIFVTYVMMVLQ